MKSQRRWWLLAGAIWLGSSVGVRAEDATTVAPPASSDLEQRIRVLERKLEIADEQAAEKAKTATKPSAAADGFNFKSADGNFAFKLHALLQGDARFFVDDKAGNETDTFLIRRVRPSIEATFFKDFNLVLVPEFGNNSATSVVDAYLDFQAWNFAKLRVGKFKPPVGLEHLQSDPYTFLPERSLVSVLVPSRDVGVQLGGEVANGALGYAFSITNGSGDNNSTPDADTNDGKEGTGRVYTKPFKNTDVGLLKDLHLGIGASYAKQNTAAPTYRTYGQQTIFTPTAAAVVDGEKIRIVPEFAWFYHSLGLIGEWAQSSQVYRVGTARTRTTNQAWQAEVAYTLTGEDTTFTGVKPRKNFDPANGGWGAWQLVGRYEQLYLDPDNFDRGITTTPTSIQRATAYEVGVNWYLNPIVRLSSSYANTNFDRGAARGDRPNEQVVLSRVQVSF